MRIFQGRNSIRFSKCSGSLRNLVGEANKDLKSTTKGASSKCFWSCCIQPTWASTLTWVMQKESGSLGGHSFAAIKFSDVVVYEESYFPSGRCAMGGVPATATTKETKLISGFLNSNEAWVLSSRSTSTSSLFRSSSSSRVFWKALAWLKANVHLHSHSLSQSSILSLSLSVFLSLAPFKLEAFKHKHRSTAALTFFGIQVSFVGFVEKVRRERERDVLSFEVLLLAAAVVHLFHRKRNQTVTSKINSKNRVKLDFSKLSSAFRETACPVLWFMLTFTQSANTRFVRSLEWKFSSFDANWAANNLPWKRGQSLDQFFDLWLASSEQTKLFLWRCLRNNSTKSRASCKRFCSTSRCTTSSSSPVTSWTSRWNISLGWTRHGGRQTPFNIPTMTRWSPTMRRRATVTSITIWTSLTSTPFLKNIYFVYFRFSVSRFPWQIWQINISIKSNKPSRIMRKV